MKCYDVFIYFSRADFLKLKLSSMVGRLPSLIKDVKEAPFFCLFNNLSRVRLNSELDFT